MCARYVLRSRSAQTNADDHALVSLTRLVLRSRAREPRPHNKPSKAAEIGIFSPTRLLPRR